MNYSKLYLKPKKEDSLLRFHPWVFSGAIKADVPVQEFASRNALVEGDIVEVYSADGCFLGVGHYQPGSITVRILSFEPEEINIAFWEKRIRDAYRLRCTLGLVDRHGLAPRNDANAELANRNNIYRLIHGEGDMLSGLIIDIYGQTAVIQAHSAGMHYARKDISEALKNVYGSQLQRIYYKSEGTLPFKADLREENEYLCGADSKEAHVATENGLTFHIDWLKGQKTGFFIDQRDNRMLLRQYAKNRSVLNMFCYTGGFSVYALQGGASMVHSVDSSAKAISLTDENINLNFPDDLRHKSFAEDAFKYMTTIDNQYDIIILDPPAFAKRQNALHNALQGYRKLNALAFNKIRSGGILFTFSCSQAVSRQDFRLAVFTAAVQSGRTVRILHQMTQPADHPINICHPEGEYLKGLVLAVD